MLIYISYILAINTEGVCPELSKLGRKQEAEEANTKS